MNFKGKKILIVDDEPDILEMLTYNLEKEEFEVLTASNGEEAVKIADLQKPDVIILDIMMPKVDGVEACRQIRNVLGQKDVYIIFLTARSEEYSEIAAFSVGADDYITKPIKPRALVSRISAYFRREKQKNVSNEEVITIGNFVIDKNSYTLHNGQVEITLPKKEFELLSFLAEHQGKVFSRDELLRNIWGTDVYVLARTVDVHIRRVREKIGSEFIKTIKGVGYKFEVND